MNSLQYSHDFDDGMLTWASCVCILNAIFLELFLELNLLGPPSMPTTTEYFFIKFGDGGWGWGCFQFWPDLFGQRVEATSQPYIIIRTSILPTKSDSKIRLISLPYPCTFHRDKNVSTLKDSP
jgi:hypothetical protein